MKRPVPCWYTGTDGYNLETSKFQPEIKTYEFF